jgi:hypothetical protein
MTPDEIKAKSEELVAFYTAKALGKILEFDTKSIGWIDNGATSGPDMQSDLSRWRVKPEPQRIWISGTAWTDSPVIAAALKEAGQEAKEFVEVLP